MLKAFRTKGKPEPEKPPINTPFDDYVQLLRSFPQYDLVFIVFDARNPISCRYQPYEGILDGKIAFIINKIDLIPRDIAIGWLNAFNNIIPTFAVAAKRNVQPVINYITSKITPGKEFKVLLTGVGQSGKKTLAKSINIPGVTVEASPPWTWLNPTPDLVAMGSVDIMQVSVKILPNAKDFLSRCAIHSLMETYKTTFLNDPSLVLRFIDKSRRNSAFEFFKGLSNGKWKFYSVPPAASVLMKKKYDDVQANALKESRVIETLVEPFIVLGYGTPNSIQSDLVPRLQALAEDSKSK